MLAHPCRVVLTMLNHALLFVRSAQGCRLNQKAPLYSMIDAMTYGQASLDKTRLRRMQMRFELDAQNLQNLTLAQQWPTLNNSKSVCLCPSPQTLRSSAIPSGWRRPHELHVAAIPLVLSEPSLKSAPAHTLPSWPTRSELSWPTPTGAPSKQHVVPSARGCLSSRRSRKPWRCACRRQS